MRADAGRTGRDRTARSAPLALDSASFTESKLFEKCAPHAACVYPVRLAHALVTAGRCDQKDRSDTRSIQLGHQGIGFFNRQIDAQHAINATLLAGLDKRLREETGLPVHVAEDPLSAVGEGTGMVLSEITFLRQVTNSDR